MEKTIIIHGRHHLIRATERPMVIIVGGREELIEQPNYMGTGMALYGVLRPGETLEEWKRRSLR